MIVICPACETRYLVDDAALGGAGGRRVRCASCGNVWQFSPEGAAIQAAVAEVAAATEAAAARTAAEPRASAAPRAEALRPEPGTAAPTHPAGPSALPRPSVAVELPAAARGRRRRAQSLGVLVLACGLVLIAILARDRVEATWPATNRVYVALHLAEPPGAGLKVTVTPRRTPDSLVITGDIFNSAAEPRRVPQLRVTLQDGNKVDLVSKVIDAPIDVLAPNGTAHFNTTFDHPSITATGVAVTFATQ